MAFGRYGGMGNPIASAIESFGAVTDILDRSDTRKAALEEQKYQRERQKVSDDQERQRFDWQKKVFDDQNTLRALNAFETKAAALMQIQNPDERNSMIRQEIDSLDPKLRDQLRPFVENSSMDEILSAKNSFQQARDATHSLLTGQTNDQTKLIDSMNALYQRGGTARPGVKDAQKRFSGFSVVPEGLGGSETQGYVVPEYEVSGVDEATGQPITYRAPGTVGADADPNARLSLIDPANAAEKLHKGEIMMDMLAALKAQYGDTAAGQKIVDRYRQGKDADIYTATASAAANAFDKTKGQRENQTAMIQAALQASGGRLAPQAIEQMVTSQLGAAEKDGKLQQMDPEKDIYDNQGNLIKKGVPKPAGSGSGGRGFADIESIRYLMETLKIPRDEAIRLVYGSGTNKDGDNWMKIYQGLLKTNQTSLTPQTPEQIKAAADELFTSVYGRAPGGAPAPTPGPGPGQGIHTAPGVAPWSNPKAPAAAVQGGVSGPPTKPAPQAPAGKTIARTGRTPDGRRVIQYTDGSWTYER